MPATRVIAFMGPAGAGKSTAAQYLSEGYGAKIYSFARPLKEMARAIWGFSDAQLYGSQAQKETVDLRWNISPRVALQKLGTDACRRFLGDDIWTRACLDQITRDHPRLAVIEDLRFSNEARAVLAMERGIVIRLECPDRESTTGEEHSSESEWREAPYSLAISAERSEMSRVLKARVKIALTTLGAV